jgi:hypothetical protein
MPKYINHNPNYGDLGPFEAESAEALADKMEPSFMLWANENKMQFATVDQAKQFYRFEFLQGLEKIDDDNV